MGAESFIKKGLPVNYRSLTQQRVSLRKKMQPYHVLCVAGPRCGCGGELCVAGDAGFLAVLHVLAPGVAPKQHKRLPEAPTAAHRGKGKKVKVYVYSPDIPVNRFSRLYIIYPQILELTLSQSHLPG